MVDEVKENNKDLEQTKQTQHKKTKAVAEKLIKVKESEYNKLISELEEYKDKHIRLYAEFDNVRKRTEREKQEFVKYANEGIILTFLDILDDLERSIDVAKSKHEDYAAFLKGIEMVMLRIKDMLNKHGVKHIEAKGKQFDPHCHEVLIQEENNDVDDNIVLEELQKGYYFREKVIRVSKVKLSKNNK